MRATNNADEIIQASTDYVGEAPKHTRKDDMVEFARGTVLMKIGNNAYKAKVVVGMRKDGSMRLYDIVYMQKTAIQKNENGTHHAVLQTEGLSGRRDAYRNDNVSQVGKTVKVFSESDKNKFSMKDKTDNQTETEAFKRWFGDSKVVDEDGKPRIMYHGTRAERRGNTSCAIHHRIYPLRNALPSV